MMEILVNRQNIFIPTILDYVILTAFSAFFLKVFLSLLDFCLQLISRHLHKSNCHNIITDGEHLLTLERIRHSLSADQLKLQKEFELHKVSNQTQKSFLEKLKNKQEMQLINITIFLKELQSLNKPLNTFTSSQQIHLNLDICQKQLIALSNGLWYPTSQDNINLKVIIENVLLLFSYKIHLSNVVYKTSLPPKLSSFKGDHLLFELILINIIGKSIYRLFDNGTVLISVKEKPTIYCIEIKDNGYERTLFTETLIKKSCDFFLTENAFNTLCRENGLYVNYSKTKNGFNVTSLLIPITPQEELSKNVIPLFQ